MERVDLTHKNTNVENLIYHLARYKFVLRQSNQNDRVLEVGCGTGYGAFFLSSKIKSITAIDVDTGPITVAKDNYENEHVKYSCLNLLENPQWVEEHQQAFDTIICFEVIEHLDRENALRLMQIINSLKKVDGVVYLSTPRYLPLHERTENRQKFHLHEYTLEELQEDLAKVFKKSVILGQLDEFIGSLNPHNVWNYFTINF